jgi:predicted small lipoprotein YifL
MINDRTVNLPFTSFLLIGALLAVVLAACGTGGPTPFPTEVTAPRPLATATETAAATETPTLVPTQTYENEIARFTLELPGDWIIEERGITSLGRYYLLGPQPLGPGPASSVLFIAESRELEPEEAAAQLQCGANSCEDEISFEEIEVGQLPALVAEITGEDTALEWIFLEHEGQLIYFTIHDPDTWKTRQDIVSSFAFVGPTPTPTATLGWASSCAKQRGTLTRPSCCPPRASSLLVSP